MYVFISHSSKDAESAGKVCALLEKAGHTCFIAPRDIPSGKEYAQEIMLGVERSQAVLCMLSANSNSSPHVLREIEHAVSRSIPIVVYKMEEVTLTKSMEYFLMAHQWMNQKPGDGYDAIVKCINSLEEPSRQSSTTQGTEPGNALQAAEPEKEKPGSKHNPANSMARILAYVVLAAAILAAVTIPIASRKRNTAQQASLGLGDSVTLGSYNGEPIAWKVIHMSENGGTAVLITEHIVTMKAYDAASSERYNTDSGSDYWTYASKDFTDKALEVKVRGNNDWARSNIRAWLNADTQIVNYDGAKPAARSMSELKNGYDSEAGFLYGFTDAEKSVIVETQVANKGNALSQDGSPVTSDKVFLLSLDELHWLEEADVSTLAVPTQAAVAQDKTGWYNAYSLGYGVDSYFWWLREPVKDCPSQCYIVCNGFTGDLTKTETVGVEGFGIRPAITVDIRALENLNSGA